MARVEFLNAGCTGQTAKLHTKDKGREINLCDWEFLTAARIEIVVVWNVTLCTFCMVYFTALSVSHRS